ncbi:MAG: hypothetical protein ACM3X9_10170 [Bacillota bacterium]
MSKKRAYLWIICGWLILGYINPSRAAPLNSQVETGPVIQDQGALQTGEKPGERNNGADLPEIDKIYGWQAWTQLWIFDRKGFTGQDQSGAFYKGSASGLHLRPSWSLGRLEGRFDFAFYNNPWRNGNIGWGVPMPGINPDLPNFLDSLAYHGRGFELNYQRITDLDFGYGLLIKEYHPTDPFHGWLLEINPAEDSRITMVSSQEIVYLAPFTRNDYASLQLIRMEQKLKTAKLNWELGLTGINENYQTAMNEGGFPRQAGACDLTLNSIAWVKPFYEAAAFDGFGGAKMFGVKGDWGIFEYQISEFTADKSFIPNYFGGKYEDLKWNSFAAQEKPYLPAIDNVNNRTGQIGGIWLEVNPLLKVGYLYIKDAAITSGLNLTAKIERLKAEGGISYYRFEDFSNYDWFIKGRTGSLGYQYHYYNDWGRDCRNDFELSYYF